jgi:regulator of RNase E activity RraA
MKAIGLLLPFLFVTAMIADLSSSSVSEAVEQLVGRRAHMTNEIHLLAGSYFIGPAVFAVFGSTFAALAKARKLAGFVVDGSVRDLGDLRRMAFPVFARGTAPGSASGHYRIDGINVSVQCGGIEVSPGDYIVADVDGVAVAPKDRYFEVQTAAKKLQDDKLALLPLIEKHGSYIKAMQERDAGKRKQ